MAKRDKKPDETYLVCDQLLADGRYAQAEGRLWQRLHQTPRAAQSILLLGVSLLLQGKYEQAAAVIDKAYQLKPWIRDDFSHLEEIYDAAARAAKALPGWQWPVYLARRDRYRWVGLDLRAAIEHFVRVEERLPFFAQVGANDGRSGDPLSRAVRWLGLPGVLVEPIPEVFDQLKENYRDADDLTFANVAIVDNDGPVKLYLDRAKRTTVASLVPERNELRSTKREKLETVHVEGTRLRTLLERYDVTQVHLLQIDTEGYDYNVLKQAPIRDLGTKIVNMEFYCLPIAERLESFDILDRAGMAYVFDGMDLLAVDREMYATEFCIFERSNEQAH